MYYITNKYNISVCVLILCATLPSVICGRIRRCTGNIYLIEAQVVQVVGDEEGRTYVQACKHESSAVPAPFDPGQLLKGVTDLIIDDIAWPSLPKTQLQTVYLNNVTLRDGWGDCSRLSFLNIKGGNYTTMTSRYWLRNCTMLRYLGLIELSVKEISDILDSTVQVERMGIKNIRDIGRIVHYPLFSNSNQSFKELTFWSDYAHWYEDVNVTWVEVSIALTFQLSLLPNLQNLNIKLQRFDMCPQGNFSSVTFKSLQRLDLQETATKEVCFRQYCIMPQLKVLLLGTVPDFEFAELFSTPTPHDISVKIGAIGTTFYLKFTRADYLALSNMTSKPNISIQGILGDDCSISRCSGNKFWLSRAMRMSLFHAEHQQCSKGNEYEYVNSRCERLDCERVPCEGGCVCCRAAGDAVVADCRDAGLRALPAALLRLPNLTELLAPNNTIAYIPDTLPDTLLLLDLSGNRIAMKSSEASALFAVGTRRLRLANNPLGCTCENQPLLDAFQYEDVQIEDIDNVECSGDTTKLSALPEVCKLRELNTTLTKEKQRKDLANNRQAVLVTTATVTTVLAIVTLLLGVALYYRRTIQMILFARGWCLCWLKDDDEYEDRRYDVFLSFCHEDAELVLDQLLPTLDQHYSVCVHLRDWVPGDMIPAHIRRSVEESRKTLIILSKHFAKSLWGLLEFQTAYASGLNERRIRVVMVVLDDVLELPDLNKDFREYVRFNTYVRWGDPWFWSKLRYALPHQTVSPHLSSQAYRPARYTVPAILDAAPHVIESLEALPLCNSLSDEAQPAISSPSTVSYPQNVAPLETKSHEVIPLHLLSPDATQHEFESASFTTPPVRYVPPLEDQLQETLATRHSSPDETKIKLYSVPFTARPALHGAVLPRCDSEISF